RSRSAVLAPADELEAPGAGLVTGVDPCALELSGLAPPVSTLRPSWVDSGLRSLLAPYEPPAAKPSALKETAATPHTNIGMNFLRIAFSSKWIGMRLQSPCPPPWAVVSERRGYARPAWRGRGLR